MTHGGNVWQGASPDQWLDYSANIRPGGPPEWVRQVLGEALNDVSYYPDPSMKKARKGLSDFLGLPEANVLPTAGGISALDLALGLEKGPVVIFTPCFSEYAFLSARYGRNVFPVSLLDGRGGLVSPAAPRIDIPQGATVCLCNPNNPTGRAFDRDEIEGILRQIERARVQLLIDEAFIDYCSGRTARGMLMAHERLLITGSMTKILGIPGVRLGYLCAGEAVIAECIRRQLTWEVSAFAAGVAAALPAHKAEVAEDARMNAARRDQLARSLNGLGAYVYPSEAAFVLARLPISAALIARRLREKGILVRECMDFAGIDDDRHLRLAVKDELSNARLIDALKEALSCGENR